MNGNHFSIHEISNAHHFLPHYFEKSREGAEMKVRMNVSKREKSWERERMIEGEIECKWFCHSKNNSCSQFPMMNIPPAFRHDKRAMDASIGESYPSRDGTRMEARFRGCIIFLLIEIWLTELGFESTRVGVDDDYDHDARHVSPCGGNTTTLHVPMKMSRPCGPSATVSLSHIIFHIASRWRGDAIVQLRVTRLKKNRSQRARGHYD